MDSEADADTAAAALVELLLLLLLLFVCAALFGDGARAGGGEAGRREKEWEREEGENIGDATGLGRRNDFACAAAALSKFGVFVCFNALFSGGCDRVGVDLREEEEEEEEDLRRVGECEDDIMGNRSVMSITTILY